MYVYMHMYTHMRVQASEDIDSDLVKEYELCIQGQNPCNLALFLDSYYKFVPHCCLGCALTYSDRVP